MKWLLLILMIYAIAITVLLGLTKIQVNDYALLTDKAIAEAKKSISNAHHALIIANAFERQFNNCVTENSARIRRTK